MASDRDRLTFDARLQFRSVVAQQGRVMVPADFNEAQEIEGEEQRKEALDFVGPSGTPDNGYEIDLPAPGPPPGDFVIQPGTMYVGGIRAELPPGANAPITYFRQPDWLDPTPQAGTREYILLSLREQEISAVEDSNLKDVALGGPDTTQRTRIIQQIVRLPTGESDCAAALKQQEVAWAAGGRSFDEKTMRLTSLARLKVGFDNSGGPPSPCDPVAQGGYLGAENQLFRVRISAPGKFVWGRDNSSFVYRVTLGSDNQTLTFDAPPVDAFHFPKTGQAVEVLRTQAKLPDGGLIATDTGQLFTLTEAYNPDTQSVKLPAAFTASAGTPQLFLRVWDAEVNFTAGTAVTLGSEGIQVTLNAPSNIFHAGDFWAFAARPSTPVEVYPTRYLDDFQPPDGPRQWICPLAILNWSGTVGSVIADCRNKFDNLVDLTKRKSGASCCTVLLKPEDLTANTTLQSVLDSLKGTSSTVCLQPGVYFLAKPLLLGQEHSGLTLEGCHAGVVLARESAGNGNFLAGLVVLSLADNITLRGIRFELPLMPFLNSGGLLADIGVDVLRTQVNGPEIQALQSAIGVRVLQCANLTIEGCFFNFQAVGVGVFEAGVFAVGECPGLAVQHNTFVHAAGQPPPVPGTIEEVRIGFLMTPAISQAKVTQNTTGAAASFAVDALVVPALLDGAAISGNSFSGLSAAALIYAEAGDVRIDSNTVRACYSGFEIFALRFERNDQQLKQFFEIWQDLAFALGATIGQGFPIPLGTKLSGPLSVKGAVWVKPTQTPPDPTLAGGVRLDSLFAAINGSAFANLPRRQASSLIVTANEIETILAGGKSGSSAFVIWGDTVDPLARLVLSSNSMRGQSDAFPIAAVMRGMRGSISGNLFLNESPQSTKFSLVVLPIPEGPALTPQVAIAGNTMRGLPLLPPHPSAPLTSWEPLNLIILI